MIEKNITTSLRIAVIIWAFSGLLGIPLAVYFDLLEGWRWTPYNAVYDQMMVSVYFAVGICSAIAAGIWLMTSPAAGKSPFS